MRKNRSGCLRWVILAAAGGALVFVFRYELGLGLSLIRSLLSGQPVNGIPDLVTTMKITIFISENILAAIFFVFLVSYWVASSAFPIIDDYQISMIMRRMIRSAFGRVAPLMIVREGVMIGEVSKSSAVLVDLSSAVVIERQGNGTTRTGQPGMVFLRGGERVRDVVSLRKHIRSLEDVRGQTREGIELRTKMKVVFTLGQPPDVIHVAYIGDEEPHNLQILQVDPKTHKIVAIRDELDLADKEEIHSCANHFLFYLEPNSQLEVEKRDREAPPYLVDDQRIYSAVYSQARDVSGSQVSSRWMDMPAMVAAEIFRNTISRYTLDDLYDPEDPGSFPLQDEIKPKFEWRVHSQGLVAYQFVQRNDGTPPQVNQRVTHKDFRIAAVQELRGAKVLRERGIKVIKADFSELTPTDPQVSQQWIENWRARWQKEADLIRADMDLEVMRIRNQARAEKQREMIEQLSSLIKSSAFSEEALSLRIFQVLEEMAADPAMRQYLPKDAFSFLKSLQLDLAAEKQPTSKLQDPGAAEEEK